MFGSCAFAFDANIYKLDDGQTVIIKSVKNNPIVIIDTWVKTGSINENDKNNGVSHFLEHLFFKGTATHPTGDFDRILESKGALTNAATSKDFTHYYIKIPSKCLDLALDLHADMLLNPLVPRKEMEKERKVVMEEIAKDQHNPNEKVYDNLNDMLYTTHPYKRRVIGSNEIIGKITRDEVLDYYRTHYSPQNMVTIIIGDVDVDHALAKVKEDFKTEPRKLERNINKPEKQLMQKVSKVDYQPVQNGYLKIGYRGCNALNPDTYALDVLSTILGDGQTSVLYKTIKDEKQLATSISADNSTYTEDGIFTVNANFIPEKSEKLQRAIFTEIENIRKNGVKQDQLDIAKSIIEHDTYFARESVSNIASEIGYTTVLTDNPLYYDEYLNNIKKVTVNDVKRVAEKYLGENRCAVSIVLPLECKNKATTFSNKHSHTAKLIKTLDDTKEYELENGAKLLITQNELNDIVAISIYVKGGEFNEKIAGTANLMSSAMMKGTKNYSATELAQIMEQKGIEISPTSTTDSFNIEILTTKPEVQKTLDLLNEIINNATFDDNEIEKVKISKLSSIKRSEDIPLSKALDEYKTLIFKDSVYANGNKVFEKTFPKIRRDDILGYYNSIFNPQNIVISVNGNVDVSQMINNFTDIFKSNRSQEFNYNAHSSEIKSLPSVQKTIKNIDDLRTAWLIVGWQTPGFLNQKDYATLEVIDSMLGSGMSSRLFRDLREQEGLAYQLGSSYSPKILRGAFSIYIGTNPKTLDMSEKMIFVEIKKLKTEFVSDKELQEAKDKILGNYILSQETNLDKASQIGWFEASGRGLEFKHKYEQLINSVTASDILEVANKYFNDNYAISIVKGVK